MVVVCFALRFFRHHLVEFRCGDSGRAGQPGRPTGQRAEPSRARAGTVSSRTAQGRAGPSQGSASYATPAPGCPRTPWTLLWSRDKYEAMLAGSGFNLEISHTAASSVAMTMTRRSQ